MNGEHQGEGAKWAHSMNTGKSQISSGLSSRLAELPCGALQERFTQALENGAAEVFEMMVGTRLYPAEQATHDSSAEYTAMIGLAGDVCGILSFRCSSPSAELIAAKMLGSAEDIPEASVRDALGEICNMVAGSFKGQLSDIAPHCMLSVPTVVSGKDYHLYPLVDGLCIQVSKCFEGAPIWMALDLHSN